MMRYAINYILGLFFLVVAGVSCSDDTPETYIDGDWSYQAPHVQFAYAQDSVTLQFGSRGSYSFSPAELSGMVRGIAGQKMREYFKGITFSNGDTLLLRVQFGNGRQMSLPATYRIQGNKMGIKLDGSMLKALVGRELNIPELSFAYVQQAEQLSLYLNWTYLKLMLNMLMQSDTYDQILLGLVESMMPGVPPVAHAGIVAALKPQVETIVKNIDQLEIGFVLALPYK